MKTHTAQSPHRILDSTNWTCVLSFHLSGSRAHWEEEVHSHCGLLELWDFGVWVHHRISPFLTNLATCSLVVHPFIRSQIKTKLFKSHNSHCKGTEVMFSKTSLSLMHVGMSMISFFSNLIFPSRLCTLMTIVQSLQNKLNNDLSECEAMISSIPSKYYCYVPGF